ncbi:MAG: hypothetical protein QM725_12025 [Lacibacter sp.]
MLLKRNRKNIVPMGYYADPAELQEAFLKWLNNSLTPYLTQLEKAFVQEFKLIPQMYKYDAHLNQSWHYNIKQIEAIKTIIEENVNKTGADDFELQIVIDCKHPHITWGTAINIGYEKIYTVFNDEEFICYGISIGPLLFNLDEAMSLNAATELIEQVLIDLRINYVQNS